MKLAVSAALAAVLFSTASLTASAQSGTSATGDQPMTMEKCDPGSPNCKADQSSDKPYSSETTGSVKSNENSAAGEAQDEVPNKDCPPGLAKQDVNPSQGRDTTAC
ncbi:hypothetical protein [Sinorhizobium arboris]|uniref:hypothetical protein n=1 Tax=Sinorhizobium arboris TaxID=76745 RepID=UPI000489C899|nr:hypothetical protein [Sinorhizobium arboris]